MKLTTIDSVVRGALMDMGMPIHWYVPFAAWALRCLRELHFDTLKRTEKVRITLDEWGEYELPDDFVGLVVVAREVGGLLQPFPQHRNVNTTEKLDDDGNRVAFSATNEYNRYTGSYRFYGVSTYRGEHKGRMFGYGNFSEKGTWSIDEGRGVLKIWPKEDWADCEVYLEYLKWDTVNLSSVLPPYAAETILTWIIWKYKDRSRSINRLEVRTAKQDYYNNLRLLRARLSNININDLRKSRRRYQRPSVNH